MKSKFYGILAALLMIVPAVSFGADQKEVILSKDNSLVLASEVGGESVAKLISQARKLDATLKSGYPINLVLDTPGGSIQAGMELIEVLKALNRPVNTLTIFAASMGFQIVQHGAERNILSYGTLMSHKAYGGFEGEFGGEGVSQIDSRYGFWLRRLKQMDEQTVSRSGGKQTLKSYRAAYENELWLTGKEAVEQGYADNVVSARCDSSLSGQRYESFNFFGFNITLKFSECPLNTYPEEVEIGIDTNRGRMGLNDFLAKGGTFGDCSSANNSGNSYGHYYSSYSTYGPNEDEKKDSANLCVTNKEVTMEKIDAKRSELVNRYTPSGKKSRVKVSW